MIVQKNIPIPSKFPFPEIQVGDSFEIPSGVNRSTVAISASRYGKKNGMKFITRKMPDGSIRVWRTE